jgi:hypothetical protein
MAVTPASLIARHPEFQDVTNALLLLAIADAVAMVDTTVIPAGVLDRVTTLVTCDSLARSPHGLPLGLVRLDGRTIYQDELDVLVRTHGRAYRLEAV